jgi:hypothetical protein
LDLFESVPPVRPSEPELGGSLVGRLSRMSSALERERAEAPARMAELLALPPAERDAQAAEPPFRTWGVAELLGREAVEQAEPARAEELAALALIVAGRLTEHPEAVVADLAARLWAIRGQARVGAGDLAGAQSALTAAAENLARGTGDVLTEAALLELEARVRETEGRPREAASLLRQAASRYSEIGDRERQARVRQWRDRLLSEGSAAESERR